MTMTGSNLQLGSMYLNAVIEDQRAWTEYIEMLVETSVELAFANLGLAGATNYEVLRSQTVRQLRNMLYAAGVYPRPLTCSVIFVYCPLREECQYQVCIASEAMPRVRYFLRFGLSRPRAEKRWIYSFRGWLRARLGKPSTPRNICVTFSTAMANLGELSPTTSAAVYAVDAADDDDDGDETMQQILAEQSESFEMTADADVVMIFVAAMFVELRRLGAISAPRFVATLKQAEEVLKTIDADDMLPDRLPRLAEQLSRVANEEGVSSDS